MKLACLPALRASGHLTSPTPLLPLPSREGKKNAHPTPLIGEGAMQVSMLDNSGQHLLCNHEGFTQACHCEEGVSPTSQSHNSCNMNEITT